MADISTELARILSAIYGEDVRGSIHDAIEKINDVSEVVLTTGTAVTSPSSSSTGFYDDSLYLNTDTFELWKCTGVNTWASQGILKGEAGDDGNGIVSIVKTSTSGLVDTYTITYTDGTTSTFDVTNGEDGANGNKWYRGTGISGKAALPTVYTGSGVADANSGDMFLNPSEGAVYSCVTGGVPTVATWQYEMTLSGGGGGTSDYADLTNKPQINGHTLSGNQTGADLGLANSSDIPTVDQTYNATSSNAQSGKAVAQAVGALPTTLSELSDTTISTPVSGQILEYNGTNWVNGDNIKDFARYGGSKVFSDLTSALLTAANVDKFFLVTDGGTISAADAANWVLPQGSVIPPDAHIAVIEYGAGIYKFDDFGGYVDISGKADKSALDDWVATGTVSGGAVSFSGIDDSGNYGYKPFAEVTASSTNKNPTAQISTLSGTGTSSMSVTYTTDADNGTTVKLRRIK